ncbi:MAG: aminotransferase class I/II-fold pyridoxal phosphate-dependent enzyme [Eubacterium sp.]|nr:aminotransferase class I/II-fold pyridoxal phosphate-dependent enzyme [Eubacterium sp.]
MSDFDHSLFHKLNHYAHSDFYPFHMPGHKRNAFLTSGTSEAQSGAPIPEAIDITEITGFDDLHHPDGVLKEAQERMAEVFGAHKSFFLVNGSTSGILAAICACTKKGGRILMARNCHKSVYHATLLQELSIDYIDPPVTDLGIAGSIPADAIRQMLSQVQSDKPYQAIVITSPTYDGIVSDISAIAALAHEHHIPLIVDEAHGAHFGFSDGFPKKALSCGADIVIESLHKTLPAFTQSAALHIADSPFISERKIKQYLSIFQTSSPSYILMAGLDQCTQLLKTNATQLFSEFEQKLAAFYKKAASFKNISVLYTDWHLQNLKDPSKILISADGIGMTGSELFTVLRDKYHLELEMASLHYATALTTIMDTQEGFDRLIRALEDLDKTETDCFVKSNRKPDTTASSIAHLNILPNQELPIPLCEAAQLAPKAVTLSSSAGKICADFIIPYPPGIPILVPGERITEKHIRQMSQFKNAGIKLYGISE